MNSLITIINILFPIQFLFLSMVVSVSENIRGQVNP